ncbi:surface carbohydrate biosynthesis protein [Pseudodesulfovibrio sp. zrk46]|uniref:surface carbohydrate biosynthesis protein n=1 Tax=Pseudodesulfovibrio sp. zrk46 TaxID=2725288 RepID=UPI001449DC26|nr:surface carbohydrate biosynthesis protein [Pseudodesulfovibrio sp. zrk46]QJB58063.1 hypothetical protein HFN16_17475 [Pseudodesulfovibrio sp. zrk46]
MKLYIVVEITSREFDAKTFLACSAALEGFDVVIGEEDMLRRHVVMSEPGIYYDKSLHTQYPALHRHLKRLGYRIVVNDDEGFIFNEKSYRNHSLTQPACDGIDLHLTWGQYQQDVVERGLPELGAKSAPVGNVRLDLLSKELRPFLQERADKLKEKWGRIVLVNSRASVVNHTDGQAHIDRLTKSGESGPADLLRRYVAWDTEVFRSFQEMIPVACARFPDRNFIIRPHPAEDMAIWEKIDREVPNAHLVREGNVHDWILASEMVIVQHGCSTAAETFLMDVPCISYLPIEDELITHGMADEVAYLVRNADDVCECLSGERDEDMASMQSVWREAAKKYVASVDGPMAATATIGHFKRIADIKRDAEPMYQFSQRINAYLRNLNRRLKPWLRKITGKEKVVNPHAKWKELTLDEFKAHVKRFAFYDSRFADLDITQAYIDCFRLRYHDK